MGALIVVGEPQVTPSLLHSSSTVPVLGLSGIALVSFRTNWTFSTMRLPAASTGRLSTTWKSLSVTLPLLALRSRHSRAPPGGTLEGPDLNPESEGWGASMLTLVDPVRVPVVPSA